MKAQLENFVFKYLHRDKWHDSVLRTQESSVILVDNVSGQNVLRVAG